MSNRLRNPIPRTPVTGDNGDVVSGPMAMFAKGTRVWCWRFLHPRWGWLGGDRNDSWSTSRTAIESAMKFCEYETQLLERIVT